MSVRLLTTALVLLLQAAGQKPADQPQDLGVACAPVDNVLITTEGPVPVQEAFRTLTQPRTSLLLLDGDVGCTMNRLPGIRENLYRSAEAEGLEVAQAGGQDSYQDILITVEEQRGSLLFGA